MIQPAKYNGINFSYGINRESEMFDFDRQRVRNILPAGVEIKYLSFEFSGYLTDPTPSLRIENIGINEYFINPSSSQIIGANYIFYFEIAADKLLENVSARFEVISPVSNEKIYSEIYKVRAVEWMLQNEIMSFTAYNNDNRFGYLTNQSFGFFNYSKVGSDFFATEKKEYEYSYSRKLILSAENQICKRFSFHNLTMYNQNLLKWLCNCQNLYIDGVAYQLISDFSESLNDKSSEILDLTADFVEVNHSFFSAGNTKPAIDVFNNEFFN